MSDTVLRRRTKRRRSFSAGCCKGSYPFLIDATSQERVIIDSSNTSIPLLSHNGTLGAMIDPPLPVIVTAHSCLLIPAAFIAWWYWTKRTTRRVVRGFLTLARGKAPSSVDATALGMSEDSVYSTPFEPAAASPSSATTDECQDAYYGLSEDSSSESSSTFRFIRWLKGTKGSRVRHKVRTATKKNLRGSPNPSESDTAEHTQNFGNSRPVHCTTYEGIVAVELCSLEEPSTPRAPFTGPETTVRITIETSPFGEFVEIPYAIASQYLERSSY